MKTTRQPTRKNPRRQAPSALRAATDELGITTPETVERPRRKRSLRVKVRKAR